jgi:hypothetical protein
MRLRVNISSTKVDNGFIEFIIKQLKLYIKNNLDIKRLSAFDSYFISNLNVTAMKVILQALNNIVYKKYKSYYIIDVDNNVKLVNNDAKLYDVCKLINYGNLAIPGYPIFTEAFKHFEEHIDMYLLIYR